MRLFQRKLHSPFVLYKAYAVPKLKKLQYHNVIAAFEIVPCSMCNEMHIFCAKKHAHVQASGKVGILLHHKVVLAQKRGKNSASGNQASGKRTVVNLRCSAGR